MDVAASIARIISLGIQVGQSLFDFYSAYKSQKSDIPNMVKKLEHLGMLENLRNPLTNRKFRADEQVSLKNIEGSIQHRESVSMNSKARPSSSRVSPLTASEPPPGLLLTK
jgi:hypothetical protein